MDLDLSFAYVGILGAQMLRRVLSLPDCQLIRLGLVGNAVGDQGLVEICAALQVNRTLTHLDARSNNVSDAGLRAVDSSLRQSAVLHSVDLRGNQLSQQAALALTYSLRASGASLSIRFPDLDFRSSESET